MNARRWVAAGSVVSAAASSACCWLPLVMVATGLSAAGALFERFRLPFLVGSGVLLGLGFYLNYRREPVQCASDGRCRTPTPRSRRLNRGMLWLSAALVLALALFPSYVGKLVGGGSAATAERAGLEDRSDAGGPTLAGRWVTDLPMESGSVRVVIHLGTLGARWVGEFDLVELRVEDYPVEVSLSGNDVKLFLTAIGMVFEGTLSPDRNTLVGTGRIGDETEPVEFRREAREPRFSEGFLALEAAADDPTLVEPLSSSGLGLRRRFNADSGKIRLLMLFSPT